MSITSKEGEINNAKANRRIFVKPTKEHVLFATQIQKQQIMLLCTKNPTTI